MEQACLGVSRFYVTINLKSDQTINWYHWTEGSFEFGDDLLLLSSAWFVVVGLISFLMEEGRTQQATLLSKTMTTAVPPLHGELILKKVMYT